MKSVLSFILVIFMMIATFFGGLGAVPSDLAPAEVSEKTELTSDDVALLTKIFETETSWLASVQLDNGAIPMIEVTDGVATVNPYFADYAALALLDNADKYAENVKAYIDWHFLHLNSASEDYNFIDGTIYDYLVTVENGSVVKEEIVIKDGKKSYDSTDSYAATFLMVLDKYLDKTGDTEYIISNRKDIVRVADCLLSTLSMGLTCAKPDYDVKYLMDNCEVYEGTLCAEALLETICNEDSSYNLTLSKVKYASRWISQTIEKKMWNSDETHYESALLKNGSVALEFSWDEFYPSATAQLFPIIHGLIPSDSVRANGIYNSFCDNYNWENFDIPDNFYWGSNVYAAVLMNDTESVMTYMNNYAELLESHSYPLYNADAAKVSMAAYIMLSNVLTDLY